MSEYEIQHVAYLCNISGTNANALLNKFNSADFIINMQLDNPDFARQQLQELGLDPSQQNQPVQSTSKPAARKLTPQEMAERQQKELDRYKRLHQNYTNAIQQEKINIPSSLDFEELKYKYYTDIDRIVRKLNVEFFEARILLEENKWNLANIFVKYHGQPAKNTMFIQKVIKDTDFECMICCRTYHEICEDHITIMQLECGHEFCKDCVVQYVATAVSESNINDLKCPNQCKNLINIDALKNYLPQEIEQKYDDFRLRNFIQTSNTFVWCQHPGCTQVINRNDLIRNITCNEQHSYCAVCNKEDHYPLDCKYYEIFIKHYGEVDLDQQWIENHSKPCPRCRINIEKNDGCNHMTCRVCHYEFCWLCLAQYPGCPGNCNGQSRSGVSIQQYRSQDAQHMRNIRLFTDKCDAIQANINQTKEYLKSQITWMREKELYSLQQQLYIARFRKWINIAQYYKCQNVVNMFETHIEQNYYPGSGTDMDILFKLFSSKSSKIDDDRFSIQKIFKLIQDFSRIYDPKSDVKSVDQGSLSSNSLE